MRFLADLISWFIHGRIPEPVIEAPQVAAATPSAEEKPAQVPPAKNVPEEIMTEGRPDLFLQELKSIKPLRRQFDKDRRDLEQEVKKLSRKRA